MSIIRNHMVYTAQPNERHIIQAARSLKDSYVKEIEYATAMSVKSVIDESVKTSLFARVALTQRPESAEAQPFCIFGVCRSPSVYDVGIPWFLGTNLEHKYRRHIVNNAHLFLSRLATAGPFRRLENYVYAGNTSSIRFIEWLGFHVEPPAPWGPYDKLFRYFWRE